MAAFFVVPRPPVAGGAFFAGPEATFVRGVLVAVAGALPAVALAAVALASVALAAGTLPACALPAGAGAGGVFGVGLGDGLGVDLGVGLDVGLREVFRLAESLPAGAGTLSAPPVVESAGVTAAGTVGLSA